MDEGLALAEGGREDVDAPGGQRGAGLVGGLAARRDGVEDRNGLRVRELDDVEEASSAWMSK